MFASTESHGKGVDFSVPVMVLIAVFSCVSILSVCALRSQTGQQYSAVGNTRDRAAVCRVFAVVPHVVPANLSNMLFLVFSFWDNFSKCGL